MSYRQLAHNPTGLGATGTRSVAAAVDALGIPTSVARVPADRRLVLDINRPESMDARALARYLGRPVPAFKAMPISALNFCSYDGVLRGPFAFRRSADELKHSSVRSTDQK